MDKFKVQDLLKICKELGISFGSAKQEQQILALMEAEEVTVEEAQKAVEAVQVRKAAAQEREEREEREEK